MPGSLCLSWKPLIKLGYQEMEEKEGSQENVLAGMADMMRVFGEIWNAGIG